MTLMTQPALLFHRLQDTVRHSRLMRSLNAIRLWMLAGLKSGDEAADCLGRALGFSEHAAWDERITQSLMRRFHPDSSGAIWQKAVAGAPRYRELLKTSPQLNRSIILKAPGEGGERGVLLMYFEYNWARLVLGLSDSEFRWLDDHFDLVLSTSWSPTDYSLLALLLGKVRNPLYVQPCNHLEAEKLASFHPNLVVLDSLPCDWIDPVFYPRTSGSTRDIDFLMVANWGEFKRHWDFFRCLQKMPPGLRVVLVGQSEGGRDSDYIRRLAVRLGVPQKLEIHQSLPVTEVAALQLRSKVSLIFSRREGCCVAAVESLFAGCALGMRADAHVGPLAYINERTGLKLRPGHLPEDLMQLLSLSGSLDPASWAGAHISCHQTHARLNAQWRDSCRRRGLPWTRDIALAHWHPYPKHASPADALALQPCYHLLHERFPRVFSADLLEISTR
jgi:glycosyltransferase involved in cell wall biosynthesis